MINETSVRAYNKIKSDNLLSKRRFEVYEYVFKTGPVTGTSIFKNCGFKCNQSGRITELVRLGVLKSAGLTVCPETKQTVHLWEVSGKIPKVTNEIELRTLRNFRDRYLNKLRVVEQQIFDLENK